MSAGLAVVSRLWLIACCAWLVACDGAEVLPAPTQVMLQIESGDNALRSSLSELRVAVALRRKGVFDPRREVVVAAAELRWPVEIPVTPRTEADASESFEVLVQARAAGRVLAEARAVVPFVKNSHRTLRLRLFTCPGQEPGFTCASEACRGADCEVCAADGGCVRAGTVDPNDLPVTPVTPVGGQDASDTMVLEAGIDAGGSQLDAGNTSDAAEAGPAADAGATQPDAAGLDAGKDAALEAGLDASLDASTDASDAAGDGSTACPADTKRCGASCIPQAQCCLDAECSGGAVCRQGSCKRWCEGQTRPADVLAADYQCLDLEQGLPSVSTWVPSTGSSNVAVSSDRAYSQPNSLRCVEDVHTRWTTTSASPPQSIELAAMINPTPPPSQVSSVSYISLVCFHSGELDNGPALRSCLMWSLKGTVDSVANYSGLWVETSGGTGLVREHPLYDPASPNTPLNLNFNAWNTIGMKADSTELRVTVNGKSVVIAGGAGPNGKVAITLASGTWAVNYDNVLVSIKR